MVAFVKLAGLSQQKQQFLQRDKFLILAGVAAVRAGCPHVAERCHHLVLLHNPQHLVKRYSSLSAAFEDGTFLVFHQHLARLCSYEKAEHLLTQLQVHPGVPLPPERLPPEDYALLLLSKADISPVGTPAPKAPPESSSR